LRTGNIASWSYRYWILLFLSCVTVSATRAADNSEDTPDQRLRNAHSSFHEMMAAPDRGIPLDLFNKSECIVIIYRRRGGNLLLL
jgi:hypothetical protein